MDIQRNLTGVPDADREILQRVRNDRKLYAACISSRYMNSLCNEDFWRQRFINRFKVNLAKYRPRYKDLYRRYINLSRENRLIDAAKDGYLEFIKKYWIPDYGRILLIEAVNHGHVRLVKFILKKFEQLPNEIGELFLKAVKRGDYRIVKVLAERMIKSNGENITYITEGFVRSAKKNGTAGMVQRTTAPTASYTKIFRYLASLPIYNSEDYAEVLYNISKNENRDGYGKILLDSLEPKILQDLLVNLSSLGYRNEMRVLLDAGLDLNLFKNLIYNEAAANGQATILKLLVEYE